MVKLQKNWECFMLRLPSFYPTNINKSLREQEIKELRYRRRMRDLSAAESPGVDRGNRLGPSTLIKGFTGISHIIDMELRLYPHLCVKCHRAKIRCILYALSIVIKYIQITTQIYYERKLCSKKLIFI